MKTLIPLCAWCKRGVKPNGQKMTRRETMILLSGNPASDVTHGVCNDCRRGLLDEARSAEILRRRIAVDQEREFFDAMVEATL